MDNEEEHYLRVTQVDQEKKRRIGIRHERLEHEGIKKSLPTTVVRSIKWGIYTESEKLALASVICNKPQERSNSGAAYTVTSLHMGTVRREEGPCPTCNLSYPDCDGHFGYIPLPAMYNPFTITHVPTVLSLFCHGCGGARFTPAGVLKQSKPDSWEAILQTIGHIPCRHTVHGKPCDTLFEPYAYLQKKTQLFTVKRKTSLVPASDAISILERAHPAGCWLDLGFKTREHLVSSFVIQSLLVPGNRSRDAPVNKLLNSIVKDVTFMKNNINGTAWERTARMNELYNDLAKLYTGNGNNEKNNLLYGYLQQRFTSKESIVRSQMIRPRAENTVYSVMNPSTFDVNIFCVPRIFQRKLTVKELVNVVTIGRLRETLKIGRVKAIESWHPKTKVFSTVNTNLLKYELQPGDRVSRFIQDGDLINPIRTPTFNAQGMMVFIIKLWDNMCFGINAAPYAGGYAGDYDGDCMVGNIVRTPEAVVEGLALNAPRELYINYTSGNGMNGPHYNSPLACNYMSRDVAVPEAVRARCFDVVAHQPQMKTLSARLYQNGIPMDSGRALFSAALPARLVFRDQVRMGCLLKGKLSVESVRDGPDCIIKYILEQYGPLEAERFVNNVIAIAGIYLENLTVSVGHDDFMIPLTDETGGLLSAPIVANFKKRARELLLTERDPERYEEALSRDTINMTNVMAKWVRDAAKKTPIFDNTVSSYTDAGVSKMAQNEQYIKGPIGQQYIVGNRLEASRAYGNPDAWASDLSNRGFIEHSFSQGMTPVELHSHATVMRKSLSDQKSSDRPGLVVIYVAAAVDVVVTVSTGGVMLLNAALLVESAYGDTGLSSLRTWNMFGKHYRSFMNLQSFSRRLLQERVAYVNEGDEGPLHTDVFQQSIYAQAFLEDHMRYLQAFDDNDTQIVNRASDPCTTSYAISDDVFARAMNSILKNEQGLPEYGEAFVVLPAWLFDLVVEPVIAHGDFRYLKRWHTPSAGVFAFILWHARNIYSEVYDCLSVSHELEFCSLLSEMAVYFDDTTEVTTARFIGLFRRELPLTSLDARKLERLEGVDAMSQVEQAYQADLKRATDRQETTTDMETLVTHRAYCAVLRLLPAVVQVARSTCYPLARVVDLALVSVRAYLKLKPLSVLYGPGYELTKEGKQERLMVRFLRYGDADNSFDSLFRHMVASCPDYSNPPVNVEFCFEALAQTDQFMSTQWTFMHEIVVMAAKVLYWMLVAVIGSERDLMAFKAPHFARVLSKLWIDRHLQDLREPHKTYEIALDIGGRPRQRGEHLVFQHYLYVFHCVVTRNGTLHEANERYWQTCKLRTQKKRRLNS